MDTNHSGYCVVLPCSTRRCWVVPQRCLGEIVTVSASDEQPPHEIDWRGANVPVIDFGREDGALPWCDQPGGTGLVAVVLGQRDEACEYFGVALRGQNLGVSRLADEEIEDLSDPLPDFVTATFRMNGNVYQVPDLLALQRAIGSGETVVQ